MEEIIAKLKEIKPEVIQEANRWINIPVLPETVEALLMEFAYDAILIALGKLGEK